MRARLGIAVLFVFVIALWLAAVWVVMFEPKFPHLFRGLDWVTDRLTDQ